MKINDTEYQLPEHVERYIIQVAEQIKARGEKGADELIQHNRTEGEIIWRRTGRSTRIVDAAIQQLFLIGEVAIRDHYDRTEVHQQLANKMKRRLDMEHGGRYKFDQKELKFTL
jgi:hypothetical protein